MENHEKPWKMTIKSHEKTWKIVSNKDITLYNESLLKTTEQIK